MTGTTGGAITAAVRTGNLSMRRSFLFPRTRQERLPFSTLISITSLPFTRPFGTVSLWSRITRIIPLSGAGKAAQKRRTGLVRRGAVLSAFFAGDAFLQRLHPERRPADTAAFPVCTALLRGDLSPGGAPPHSGGSDALGGDSVPAPVRPAVFLHACTSSQSAGGDGAV